MQEPEDDDKGFLFKPLICKAYRPCNPTIEYTMVDGSMYGDRDYVCAKYTKCNTALQFTSKQQTPTSDNICQDFTQCNPDYQYLLQKGNLFRDNLCATKTRCTAQSFRNMYEKVPPKDATSDTVNGTDAVCEPYSNCPDGHEIKVPGTDTSDHECGPCSIGTFRNSNESFQASLTKHCFFVLDGQ